jgi:hypothetical protein
MSFRQEDFWAIIRADVGSLLKCRLLAFANSPTRFLAGLPPVLGKRLTGGHF